ncbi:hypothetical protein Droror1_Dr00008070 [Drosera rotundifolia]
MAATRRSRRATTQTGSTQARQKTSHKRSCSTKARQPTSHKHSCNGPSPIELLPSHLAVQILARVASSSLMDLYNSKLCCKELRQVTEDDYVYEHASIPLEKFPVIPWSEEDDKVKSFLRRCMECGNTEALYREGMADYFSRMKAEVGLDNLRRAAAKGHAEASCVYGIILLYTTKAKSIEGMKLLADVLSNSAVNVTRLQRRIRAIISQMWLSKSMARTFCELLDIAYC